MDNDISYLSTIEIMLLRMYGEKIELVLITDRDLLHRYFSASRSFDLLLINENFYYDAIKQTTIKQIYLLTEEERNKKEFPVLYKYTSAENILKVLNGVIKQYTDGLDNRCKRIMVYSPQGGSGKTTIALGVAVCLVKLGKRVLYVDAEDLQDYDAYVDVGDWMTEDLIREMKKGKVYVDTLKSNIVETVTPCLAPLHHSLLSYGLSESDYESVIQCACNSGLFDYVIVDSSSCLDLNKSYFLDLSDYVLLPIVMSKNGLSKMTAFLRDIDIRASEKYLVVLNRSNGRQMDMLDVNNMNVTIAEAIPNFPDNRSFFDEINNFMSAAYYIL